MIKYFILGFAFLSVSTVSFAETSLKKADLSDLRHFVIPKVFKRGLVSSSIDSNQSFNIISNGQKQGTLIQGKGWVRDVHSVCFINWSTQQNQNAFFMQTMGADDWETVDCDKVESVGVISKPNDKSVKIAVVYNIYVHSRYTQDYVILGLKNNNEIYYDEKTTEQFQNSYVKDIAAMRKEYQSLNHNN